MFWQEPRYLNLTYINKCHGVTHFYYFSFYMHIQQATADIPIAIRGGIIQSKIPCTTCSTITPPTTQSSNTKRLLATDKKGNKKELYSPLYYPL